MFDERGLLVRRASVRPTYCAADAVDIFLKVGSVGPIAGSSLVDAGMRRTARHLLA